MVVVVVLDRRIMRAAAVAAFLSGKEERACLYQDTPLHTILYTFMGDLEFTLQDAS
jgi:hypothetical protein